MSGHESAAVASTIEEVLVAIDGAVARALEAGSRLGYFAALYRKVTAKVKEGIAVGFFDDGERMERLMSSSPTATCRRCASSRAVLRPPVVGT